MTHTIDLRKEMRKSEALHRLSRLTGVIGAIRYLANPEDSYVEGFSGDLDISLAQLKDSLDEVHRLVEAI